MSRPSTPSNHLEANFRFVEEGTGHGVIIATAGSGKTTTLVEVAHRLPTGTSSCFLAFNAAATKQLKDTLPAHLTARTVHALGLKTLAARVRGRKLARVYPQKYTELVKARLRNREPSYRVSPTAAAQAAHYLRELAHYARVNLAQETKRGGLEQLAQTYHLRPPEHAELMSDLHTQLWNLLRNGVTLALERLCDYMRLHRHDLRTCAGELVASTALRAGVGR